MVDLARKRRIIHVENLKGFGRCGTCKGIYKDGSDFDGHLCVLPRELSPSKSQFWR